jgi:hypothetical protein
VPGADNQQERLEVEFAMYRPPLVEFVAGADGLENPQRLYAELHRWTR